MQHNNLPDLFREDLESLIIFMMLGGIGQLGGRGEDVERLAYLLS